MYRDDDPWADVEAMENERFEADMEQAEMTRVGNAFHAAQQDGICTHGSTVGYLADPVYPEQEGLRPGQSKCTAACGRVFESDEAWHAAVAEAVRDYL
jgi:N-methylhydantoinase A/oxoprolinase/acetone carboxylase beta subunit